MSPMDPRRFLLVTLALSCLVATTSHAAEETTVDGVLQVRNAATPPQPARTLKLTELWRHGGDDDDVIFGVTGRILTDSDGNSYVLDQQLSEIQVFAPNGDWLRTIGREGEGPGEFRNPGDMFFTPDGHLGIAQQMPGKIIQLTRDGVPLDNFPFGSSEGFVFLARARPSGENLVVSASASGFAEGAMSRTAYLATLDPSGQELARFHEESSKVDFAELKFREVDLDGFGRTWAVGSDGRLYVSLVWDEYSLTVYNPDGSVDRRMVLDYKPTVRTEEQKKAAKARFGININGRQAEIETAPVERCIAAIHPRPDGTLWVMSDQGSVSGDGRLASFDEFDGNGHLLRQVHVQAEGDLETDLLIVSDHHLYVVTGFRDAARTLGPASAGDDEEEDLGDVEPLTVICYRID